MVEAPKRRKQARHPDFEANSIFLFAIYLFADLTLGESLWKSAGL
jgi:hypothetical protein